MTEDELLPDTVAELLSEMGAPYLSLDGTAGVDREPVAPTWPPACGACRQQLDAEESAGEIWFVCWDEDCPRYGKGSR